MKENIVLLGCGDVGPVHGAMETYGALIRPVFAAGDIRFGQCERTYSEMNVGGDKSAYLGSNVKSDMEGVDLTLGHRALKPHMISVFTDCGFDVVSLASNHTMDWGGDVLLDTIARFKKNGIQVIGAGRNLQEARQPVIIDKNGVRTAFLGYCSVLKDEHAAGPNKTGIAPLRAHTSYEKTEWQPGIPPRVVTIPYEEDLQGMVEDVAKAKKEAHVVVVSVHWGIHIIPRMIAEYQPIAAKAAFNAGADLILGHHPHVPKAIEVDNGKVCFYSLGNFMFTTLTGLKPGTAEKMKHYGVTADLDEYPHCPQGKDAHHSLIAKAVLSRNGVEKVSFLPVLIDKQCRPEVLSQGDRRFDENVSFMDWVSEGFDHKFKVEGDEVVLKG